jgi:hypothetical protein
MKVRMTSELFYAARMNGVVLPHYGEVVDFGDDTESAEALIKAKHAEAVEDEPEAEPEKPAEVEQKRGPGRPPKNGG